MLKPAIHNIISSLAPFGINLPDSFKFKGLCGELHNDSRKIVEGDVFCAIIGHDQDGREYIEKAIKQGAKLVLAECESKTEHGELTFTNVTSNEAAPSDKNQAIAIVKFYQLNQHLFELTKTYYQVPQDNMTIVGITGTNGKTTTSQLLAQMLNASQKPCAVIGTNGAGSLNKLHPIDNTTPGACELHQLLNRFSHKPFSYVAMEVSSHALSQKRVQADLFDIAIFTNLTRDHLDYHGSMACYGEAKQQIFTHDNNQIAVVNFDDNQAKKWLENWPALQTVWLYGRHENINKYKHFVTATHIERHTHGVSFTLESHLGNIELSSRLLGDFNIDNLLAAVSVLLIQDIALNDIPNLVSKINATAGRTEATSAKDLATAVVDYAHSPDALEKALQACRQHCNGELYVVFGCGGDRDKGKRALMAKTAEEYADYLVVTNDNPRSENPQMIANDILAGFTRPEAKSITVTLDREKAVLNTLQKAQTGDIVLLAGKGHEDYVIVGKYNDNGEVIGTQKLTYDERLVVKNFYQQHAGLALNATMPTKANV